MVLKLLIKKSLLQHQVIEFWLHVTTLKLEIYGTAPLRVLLQNKSGISR